MTPDPLTSVEPPVLSVVVPTHDVGVYVDECLRSIARQEIGAMEVIVVDDHSSDDTVERVRAIASADARFRLIESTERGGALARNRGAELATGRYLIFIDGDDIVPDGAFAALIDSLERTGSDMACGRYLKFSATRTWDPTLNWPVYKDRLERVTLEEHPSLIRGRACWNKMFRRDFWVGHALAFPNVVRSNDILPMTQALVRARSIDVIPDVVYLYRERPGSRSMTSRAAQSAGVLSYLEQELACFDELEPVAGPGTLRVYVNLLFQADLWVHVARFVPQADAGADPDSLRRVSSLVASCIERTPWREWKRISPDHRRYLQFVAEGRYAALRGLDASGEIAVPSPTASAAAFAVIGSTIAALSREGDAFERVIERGFRRGIAAPMWALDDDADDDAVNDLLREIGHLDRVLPAAVRPLLTANERQLLRLSALGDTAGARELIRALALPPPSASVTSVGRQTFALALDLHSDPPVLAVRIVGRHRDSGEEISAPWLELEGGQRVIALSLDVSSWRALGVWLLELDVRTPRLLYRRPIAALAASPAEPTGKWATVRMSRVKRPGHHVVFLREPTPARKLASALRGRARRLVGRR